ncbi:Putative TrmH family tRNA/rRNA methyltransferase [bacterium HR17]|uniref:TrmH family tRNA/rRNA methyltransferase n=1 Tax=Candidatus Fervidibacter japonicus TaxID=2035412 RepID=A0A2H5XDT3_9BACT|nr:Putative TrmH family tRNA/rRNA methyltransferase [bacterium HR17]
MRQVTSRHNDTFKFLKALTEPTSRKKHRAFLLEGATFVAEALAETPSLVRFVVLTPEVMPSERGQRIIALAQQRAVPVVVMAPELFAELSATATPQGVIAALAQPEWANWQQRALPERCLVVVLESVQDPTNVGAIVRTADAVGTFAVLYTKGTADPFAPKAVRASAGSVLHLPVLPIASVSAVADWFKTHQGQLVATVPQNGVDCFEAAFADRVAIVVGNEARGVSAETLMLADLKVRVPMDGKARSLNAAVATGIVLYEWWRRQRQNSVGAALRHAP